MVITIKLRENSAYFTPTRILYADNENLEITVRDKGRIVNRGFLLFNENLYALTDKGCVIPHNALKTVNISELQDRIDDKIVQRWRVETLFCHKYSKEKENNARLDAEREFYKANAVQLRKDISELQENFSRLEKTVRQLENGKFRLFNFKTEEQKQ